MKLMMHETLIKIHLSLNVTGFVMLYEHGFLMAVKMNDR